MHWFESLTWFVICGYRNNSLSPLLSLFTRIILSGLISMLFSIFNRVQNMCGYVTNNTHARTMILYRANLLCRTELISSTFSSIDLYHNYLYYWGGIYLKENLYRTWISFDVLRFRINHYRNHARDHVTRPPELIFRNFNKEEETLWKYIVQRIVQKQCKKS